MADRKKPRLLEIVCLGCKIEEPAIYHRITGDKIHKVLDSVKNGGKFNPDKLFLDEIPEKYFKKAVIQEVIYGVDKSNTSEFYPSEELRINYKNFIKLGRPKNLEAYATAINPARVGK